MMAFIFGFMIFFSLFMITLMILDHREWCKIRQSIRDLLTMYGYERIEFNNKQEVWSKGKTDITLRRKEIQIVTVYEDIIITKKQFLLPDDVFESIKLIQRRSWEEP